MFLAAAVAAEPNQVVLDVGCGAGAASLCLAARLPQCRIVGLDLQRDLVRLASDNVVLNGMSARVSAMVGDLLRPPPRLSPGMFDHVMANPPFIEAGRGTPPGNRRKPRRRSRATPISAPGCASRWRWRARKGTVTFVHRADRVDALLGHLAGRTGEIVIFPLWPAVGRAASRVLVRARTQVSGPARLMPGLVLHESDGRFSEAAEAVLRGGAALPL